MKPYKQLNQQTGFFLISLFYGLLLQSLPLMAFKDRISYIKYAGKSDQLIEGYLSHGVVKLISNEPIWLLLNVGLEKIFTPEYVVKFIIFFSAFGVSYIILKYNSKNWYWIIIFLMSPQVLLNFTIHLRQGLAIAIFLYGYYSKESLRRYMFIAFASLIHSSFLFLVPFLFFHYFLLRINLSNTIQILVILMISFLLIFGLEFVLSFLSARQASAFKIGTLNISGIGFLFWAGVGGLFILQGRTFFKENTFAFYILILYLSSYYFLIFSARIFESGLLIVLLAGLLLTSWRKYAFIIAYTSLMTYLWVFHSYLVLPNYNLI